MSFHIEGCVATAETERAILVESDFFDEGSEWIPKSQIDDDSEVYAKGTDGTLVVTDWIAEQKGWR